MVWTITILILISLIKLLPTVLPLKTVNWLLMKFEIHSKLTVDEPILVDGKEITGEEKHALIKHFNEAIFMEKHYVYPGTEHLYLPPEKDGTPIIIDTKRGKLDIRLYLYKQGKSVDVVKQIKKKIISYNVSSEKLQQLF